MHDYEPRKDLLHEHIILVTGAGDGIGKAAALAFADHGVTVILLGRSERKLEAVYDEIERQGWPQAAVHPLDLAQATDEDFNRVAAAIDKEFGRLDGLLHNAAELGTLTPLALYNDRLWSKVMQVNVTAPYLLTRACLDLLARSPDASVVFTTADVGRRGRAYWGAYGIACFALEGMMQIWADELEGSTAIRVNSIDPGPVATALRRNAYPGEDPGKLRRPEEIMNRYLYLMGADSKGVTGHAFSAQGEED